jgi:tRNA G37 N-methylase Trm5
MPETVALYRAIAHDAVGMDGFAGTGMLAIPTLPAQAGSALTARELVESARHYLARADAQLQLTLPFL